MGRYGHDGFDSEDAEFDEPMDWQSFRPIKPVKKERIRLNLKPKALPAQRKRIRLRSPALELPAEKTTLRDTILAKIRNNIDINTRDLKRQFPMVSIVTLFALKVEVRREVREPALNPSSARSLKKRVR